VLLIQGATGTAASGPEALDALALGLPDVIVSDIGMPETDNSMFLRKVRALTVSRGGRTPTVWR
jgi:CheY-like chemotaxis protein